MTRTKRMDHVGAPKPTILDVARHAGVSAATVSYVLNGRFSQVSGKTVEKVRTAVDQLGYVKNLTASALSSRRSNMIGVLLPDVLGSAGSEPDINPFYGEFIFLLEAEARSRGYALCFYAGREDAAPQFLLQRHLEAAIIVGFSPRGLAGVVEHKRSRVLLYDSFLPDAGVHQVRTDEERGGALAAEHLLRRGCRKPLFVGGYLKDYPDQIPAIRARGARRVFEAAGASLQVLEGPTNYSGGLEAARRVRDAGADGVVCIADIVAAGLIEGLRQMSVHVPGDVAVTGYDNLPISRHVRPQLTTVDQRLPEKVRALMDLVDTAAPPETRVIEPHLIARASA